MASAQISALQKSMERGFSWMAESLTTAQTQTLERYVCEEVTEPLKPLTRQTQPEGGKIVFTERADGC